MDRFSLRLPQRVALLVAASMMLGCANEETRWRDAQEENSVSAYEEFVALYPDSVFADSALFAIEALKFSDANSKGTIEALEEFLAVNPDTRFADSASFGIETIHFNTATAEGTVEALEEFQAMFPEGAFADSVRQVLDSLLPPEPQLSNLVVMNAQREECRFEFTVSVSHRSGSFGPERPPSAKEARLFVTGDISGNNILSFGRVDDVVSKDANHTTLRDSFRISPIVKCTGEARFEFSVTDADGHESNKVQALVDFGTG